MRKQDHTIVAPHTNDVTTTLTLLDIPQSISLLDVASNLQPSWAQKPLSERQSILTKFLDLLQTPSESEAAAKELSTLIGRPLQHSFNELKGFDGRGRWLIKSSAQALAPQFPDSETDGLQFKVKRHPIGTMLIISAWNYPYLVTINSLLPSLLAGNAVLIKHAPQTFPIAWRLVRLLEAAGVPKGLVGVLQAGHDVVGEIMKDSRIGGVVFTGSTRGGAQVEKNLGGLFKPLGLELGGKDPAYVREDADIKNAAANVVDGAMYNSGQSCCAVERVYVHEK
ncbi:hypothetical protein HDV05_008345, partial [Chytridiales sp. JEL 0842]